MILYYSILQTTPNFFMDGKIQIETDDGVYYDIYSFDHALDAVNMQRKMQKQGREAYIGAFNKNGFNRFV